MRDSRSARALSGLANVGCPPERNKCLRQITPAWGTASHRCPINASLARFVEHLRLAMSKPVLEQKVIRRARRTLRTCPIAALATVSGDGRPWNSPVFVAFDDRLTFYWTSRDDARHSRNIDGTPEVFLTVFDGAAPDDSGRGIYIRARARMLLHEREIDAALDCLAKRKREQPKSSDRFLPPHRDRVYSALPRAIWTNVVTKRNGVYVDERSILDKVFLLL
jgi:uncharacterized protein YhbP (UPF0306 family)